METSAVAETTATEVRSAKDRNRLAADLDSFLLLLVTQLQNQDPLSPLEPTEFTGQLVAFAGVEQQITTNANLEKLLKIQDASFAAAIVGFIGTQVEAESNQLSLQDGKAELTYSLSQNAKSATIAINDSDGNIISLQTLDNTAGEHEFIWDGKDQDGNTVPDGAYAITITAIGSEEGIVETSVKIKGRVTGISIGDETVLDVGGVLIALDDVLAIQEITN